MAKNESYWLELTDLDPFIEESKRKIEIWKWSDLMEKDGRIRAIDVMRLRNLIEAVYEAGRDRGRD